MEEEKEKEQQQKQHQQQAATTDRDVLLILFRETEGQLWHNNAGWGSDRPLDEWHGVTATSAGRVVALELRYNNLRGVLPPQLGKLNALEQLHLTNNELYGNIPQEFGQLHALKELRLYCNQLSGSIPPEIGQLCALRKLVLYSNKLSGAVPPELEGLHALEELLLSDNRHLEGDIPPKLDETLARNKGGNVTENFVLKEVVLDSSVLPPPPALSTVHGSHCASIFSPITSSVWDYTRGASGVMSPEGEDEDNEDGLNGVLGAAPFVTSLQDKTAVGGADRGGAGKSASDKKCFDDGRNGTNNVRRKPLIARVLDTMATVWHVLVPMADDLTSALLLVRKADVDDTTGPLWWACALALSAAGFERAWLLGTLCATAVLMPILWCARAVLACLASLLRFSARLCSFSRSSTVCCLFLLLCGCGCCRGCLSSAEDGHPPCTATAAAHLFARLNCSSGGGDHDDDSDDNFDDNEQQSKGSNGLATPLPRPTSQTRRRGRLRGGFIFVDALLWALIGSRARCSRFWDGLGLRLDMISREQASVDDEEHDDSADLDTAVVGAGAGAGAGADTTAPTFGDVLDFWVDIHPFYWLGNIIFGKIRPSGRSGCVRRRRRWCCCGSGGSSLCDRRVKALGGTESQDHVHGSNAEDGKHRLEEGVCAKSGRRSQRRGRVLRRAVGETVVVDFLFLALSVASGGGWDGSLAGIVGISALFSALQLLTELRYYVKESIGVSSVSSNTSVWRDPREDYLRRTGPVWARGAADADSGGYDDRDNSSNGGKSSEQKEQWSSCSSMVGESSAGDMEQSYLSSTGNADGDDELSSSGAYSEDDTTTTSGGGFDVEEGVLRKSGGGGGSGEDGGGRSRHSSSSNL